MLLLCCCNIAYFFCHCQARSQEFAMGGGGGFFGSWKQQQTILTQIFISFQSGWGGFSVKFRWSPKEKKKVFTEIESVFLSKFRWLKIQIHPFSSPNHIRSLTNSRPNPNGGAIFVFWGQIDLKSAKNEILCILFRPMGEGYSPPAPFIAISTGSPVLCVCINLHLPIGVQSDPMFL